MSSPTQAVSRTPRLSAVLTRFGENEPAIGIGWGPGTPAGIDPATSPIDRLRALPDRCHHAAMSMPPAERPGTEGGALAGPATESPLPRRVPLPWGLVWSLVLLPAWTWPWVAALGSADGSGLSSEASTTVVTWSLVLIGVAALATLSWGVLLGRAGGVRRAWAWIGIGLGVSLFWYVVFAVGASRTESENEPGVLEGVLLALIAVTTIGVVALLFLGYAVGVASSRR